MQEPDAARAGHQGRTRGLGADLHAPLGQNRRTAAAGSRRLSPSLISGIAAVSTILGLSIYAAVVPEPLQKTAALPQNPTLGQPADNAAAEGSAASRPSATGQLSARAPHSGANVERTTMPDGTVVTKFTPRPRGENGPALIDTPRIGQDPRMAAMPNEDLLEDTVYGPIPVIGPDGLRPVEQYARPWSGARGTRIAIVVGGLGLSQTGTQRAIKQLPEEVTFAFAATGNSLQRWMKEARNAGHEILLQIPMEPFDYPANDPGRGTLRVDQSPADNLDDLHQSMASITNYTGVMNYMGGRFLADAEALDPMIRDIAARGLLFLDDGSSAQSLVGQYAKTLDMPHAFADLQLDGQLDEKAILTRLDELERIARKNGTAIGTASAFDESIAAIRKWSEEATLRGIEIVGVSAIATDME